MTDVKEQGKKGWKSGGESAVPTACGAGKSRAILYARLRVEHPEWTDTQCRKQAGYSGEHAVKAAAPFIQDMRQRIEAAQAAVGCTVQKNLQTLDAIRATGEDKDKITAIKVMTEITGERMPERIDMTVRTDDELLRSILKDTKDEDL